MFGYEGVTLCLAALENMLEPDLLVIDPTPDRCRTAETCACCTFSQSVLSQSVLSQCAVGLRLPQQSARLLLGPAPTAACTATVRNRQQLLWQPPSTPALPPLLPLAAPAAACTPLAASATRLTDTAAWHTRCLLPA